jgi:hypothetical protein
VQHRVEQRVVKTLRRPYVYEHVEKVSGEDYQAFGFELK